MAQIKDINKYVYNNYPQQEKLSEARLIRMIYLADWRSAIIRKKQLTNISWEFGENGPDPGDSITEIYIPDKSGLKFLEDFSCPSLTSEDKNIINHVIETVSKKNWEEFISLINSTYPILTQPRFSKLDLVSLAELYKIIQTEIIWNAKTNSDTNNF